MKLPITDQFLWDVYNFLEESGEAAHFIFRRRRTLYDVLQGPRNPIIGKYIKDKNRQSFSQLIYHLKKNNYIKVKNLKGNKAFILTERGIDKALKVKFKLDNENRPKRKDGKWIMLIFDVPEKYRKSRDLLRSILYNLGYKLFQKSVWVSPYDVSEKTEALLQKYSLDGFVKIFLIEEIK
ncbi:MAG: hypothetical protein AAB340_02005 [Patescibacteria group bacterium]